jgi:hypothetical protein
MPIFSRVIFTVVRWSARRGLRDAVDTAPQRQNQEGQPDEKFEQLSVSYAKQSLLVRTAQRFSSEPLLTRLSDAL